MDLSKIDQYQNGGEGMTLWCEENVRVNIPIPNSHRKEWRLMGDLPTEPDPDTGRSWAGFWQAEKDMLHEALEMRNGKFRHRLIVFCWMRGEGKSFIVCLVQLWKFFCFPHQMIVLGANSKDQVKFVHYDIMRDLILNSPNLLEVIGRKNIQEKQINLRDPEGNIISTIRAISSFSGIVSNITGYTFSEIFDMSNPKFYVQLDGSTRNIPNALGTIDSTVSRKDHVLYQLYQAHLSKSDRTLYFNYRNSPEAHHTDFWHPLMTQEQLKAYSYRFPVPEFNQYFKNTWDAAAGKLFPEAIVEAIRYIGVDGEIGSDPLEVRKLCEDRVTLENRIRSKSGTYNRQAQKRSRRTKRKDRLTFAEKIDTINKRLLPVDSVYSLQRNGIPMIATLNDLKRLGDIYDTDWAILAGIDRSDPMAKDGMARTIVTAVAKGLRNSRGKGVTYDHEKNIPNYVYFLLALEHVEAATLEGIKSVLRDVYSEFDGIDTLCAERWGCWDLAPWCDHLEIAFEATFPSYEKQKKCFTELYVICADGRFKAPSVGVPGSKQEDILTEELGIFDYDSQRKWYGTPEKDEKNGIQDDSVFSLGWCVYGGRDLGVGDFRPRYGGADFGTFISNRRNLLGRYGERHADQIPLSHSARQ